MDSIGIFEELGNDRGLAIVSLNNSPITTVGREGHTIPSMPIRQRGTRAGRGEHLVSHYQLHIVSHYQLSHYYTSVVHMEGTQSDRE